MGQWAFSMENVLGLNLPWRSLSSHLVTTDKDGNIDYMSGFQDVHIQKPVKEVSEIAPVKTWLAPNILWTTYEFLSSLKSWSGIGQWMGMAVLGKELGRGGGVPGTL